MPARKKSTKNPRGKPLQKGYAGTSVLYLVILTGAVVIGFLLAGSGLPEQSVKNLDQAIVTIIPHDGETAKPNLQLQTFGGVTGLPTPIPTKRPSPTTSMPPTQSGDTTTPTCESSASSPTAPLTGYRLTKCEDFNGTTIPSGWSAYNGGGGDTVVGAGRKQEQCTVGGGILVQTQNTDGATCGMTSNFAQKYGFWEVKMRAYSTGSGGSAPHPVLILWPDTDVWADGELDYFESDIGEGMGVFLHCVGNPSANCYHTTHNVDVSQWHVYGFEWTATGFKGFVDGQQIYETGGNGSNPNVSMHQTIQLDNLTGQTPVSPAKMEVDWVHMYSK